MDLFSLPPELISSTVKTLTDQELNDFCKTFNKQAQQFCEDHIYTNYFLTERYGENLFLPVTPTNGYEKLLWYQAIYGSSLASAHLVHPDYACIQALKLRNDVVYDKYKEYTSEGGKIASLPYLIKAGKFEDYFEHLTLAPEKVGYFFDLPAPIVKRILTETDLLSDFDTMEMYPEYLNERIVDNILTYGRELFEDYVIEDLEELKNLKPYQYPNSMIAEKILYAYENNDVDYLNKHVTDVEEFFIPQYITADLFKKIPHTFDMMKAVIAWNRWDLYKLIGEFEEDRAKALVVLYQQPSHLSPIGLEIMYKLHPNDFGVERLESLGGYEQLIQFYNKRALPIPYGTLQSDLSIELALENPLYLTRKYILHQADKLYVPNAILKPLHDNMVNIPIKYYVLSSNIGRIAQLAAGVSSGKLAIKFYGQSINDDETPLAQMSGEYDFLTVYNTAVSYGTNMVLSKMIDEGISLKKLQGIVPKDYDLRYAGIESLGKKKLTPEAFDSKEDFLLPKDVMQVIWVKTFINKPLLKDIIARYGKLNDKQGEAVLYQIARKSNVDKNLIVAMLSKATLEKLVPITISYSIQEYNNIPEWIKIFQKQTNLKPNLEYYVLYYNAISIYGLSIMSKIYKWIDIAKLLREMLKDWRVPKHTKDFIQSILD